MSRPAKACAFLAHLAAPGAYGRPDPTGAEAVIVVGARKGVSVRVASAPPARVAALVSEGLAVWERPGETLVATPEGRARAAREATTHDNPFLAQHATLVGARVTIEGEEARVSVDAAESPLAWLRRRKGRDGAPLIGAAAFEAGERLRADLTAASMMPRVTADWSAGPRRAAGTPTMAFSERVLAARQRVGRALDAVGPDLGGLLMDVCGFLKGLEEVERERGWPARSAKVVLGIGLERLAGHYGLAEAAVGPSRSRARAWGADDFRPRVDGLP